MEDFGTQAAITRKECTTKDVLRWIMERDVGMWCNPHAPDRYITNAKELLPYFECSLYKMRQTLHKLVEQGWIERASIGYPAVESFGEVRELVEEAHPPINGYGLTTKAYKSNAYEKLAEAWEKELEEMTKADYWR